MLRELRKGCIGRFRLMRTRFARPGISLDQRVSFSVENADREHLLDALLTPAGWIIDIEGEQVRVMPARYRNNKPLIA